VLVEEGQSWKEVHAAHVVRADIFIKLEDILVQKSWTNVAIADSCGNFAMNIEG
jgi:hypothetical protein